jgi:hypothetical protein
MIISLEENKFLLIGTDCHITFKTKEKYAGKDWQYGKARRRLF